MSFGCERSCSSPRRVSNFNSKENRSVEYFFGDIMRQVV